MTDLCQEGFFVSVEGVEIDLKSFIIVLKDAVVPLQLLGFPAGSSILEPDGYLARLQAQFLG